MTDTDVFDSLGAQQAQISADLRALRMLLAFNALVAATTGATMVGLAVYSAWSPLWALFLLCALCGGKLNLGAKPKVDD